MKISQNELIQKSVTMTAGVLLMLLALASLVIAILDFTGTAPEWFKKVPDVTLLLLGAVALYLSVERPWLFFALKKSIEQLNETATIKEARLIQSLPDNSRKSINEFIERYIELNLLKEKTRQNIAFSNIADKILKEQTEILDKLSVGQLEYPETQIPTAHRWLSGEFRHRLDAVSDDDIDFWMEGLRGEPAPADYFELNTQAVKNGSIITRIFLLKARQLEIRFEDIVKVLISQDRAEIGWAIAIKEFLSDRELERLQKTGRTSVDFALFDGGKAVSYFRKFYGRRFEAVFQTHDEHFNSDIITAQKNIHKHLISECWLVNKQFKDIYFPPTNHSGFIPGGEQIRTNKPDMEEYPAFKDIEEIKEKAKRYNSRLERWLTRDEELKSIFPIKDGKFYFEDDIFPLIARDESEIKDKVRLLGKIAMKNLRIITPTGQG